MPPDVWFTFTTAASGTGSTGVTVQPSGNGSTAIGTIRVYRAVSCAGPFTQLGCSTNTFVSGAGTAAPLVVNGLAPGTTYYVRVDEGGYFNMGTAGPFSICVVGALGCAAPSALYPGITTSSTAPLYYTAGNNNVSYTITYVPEDGGTPQTVTTTATSYTLTGLLPGTRYTVSVVASCGIGMSSAAATTSFTTALDNNEPCGALPLPLNPSSTCQNTVYGSTLAATNTVPYGYADPGCGTSTSSPNDVWYSFQTPASGPASTAVEVTLASGTGHQLRVFSAASCAGPFTEIGCAGVSLASPAPLPLAVRGLTPGTTYFVRVARATYNAPTAFTLCLRPAPTCAPPTGLAVSAANSLSFSSGFGAGSYTVTYQLASGGAVQVISPAPTASPVQLAGLTPGLAYTATVTSSCGPGQASAIASISFVAGGCASRAYAALPFTETFEADWLSVCDIHDAPSGYWRTTPATGYNSWRRDDDGATAGWGGTGPGNGDYTPTGGQGSTHSARFHSVFARLLPAGSLDLLVNLSAPGSKRVTFDYLNPSGADSLVVLLSTNGGSSFQPLHTYYNQATFSPQVVDFAATSATAIIRFAGNALNVTSNATDLAIDNVQVGFSPACASPLLSATGIGPTTATLVLTGGNGATVYTVTYQPFGGALQTITPNASPVALSGLQPGTTYTVTAVSNCAGGFSTPQATLTFSTPAVPTPADECSTATLIGVGQGSCPSPVLVNNAGATTSSLASCRTVYNDLWYRVTVPANGILEATTSTSTVAPNITDTVMELYTGTCGSLTSIGCNDDIGGGNNFSQVRATGLTPGTTVYVRVWAYGTAQGTFNLCVRTDAACPSASGLLATVSGTGASLAFTGPANASGYTVTYTPAGGTPTTVAATGSPVVLSGLLPFTAYTVSVVTNCTGGLMAAPATGSFSTSPYCTALGGSCGTNTITGVAIAGTTLNNPANGCSVVGTTAYSAFPGLGSTTTTLYLGRSYQFSVDFANGTSSIMAWIDYDQSGTFDTGEAISVASAGQPILPALASFAVPGTARTGRTGLRLRSRSSSILPTDACTTFPTGETEDYLITISMGAATHESALAAQIGLYPNPATTAFTLTLPADLQQQPVPAGLYNGLGQLVREQLLPAHAAEASIDVSGLARGVYAVRLRTSAGVVVKRVVVE